MDQSAWTEQGAESRRDNNGGKHERDRGQCAQKRFAAKVIAGKEIGRRKPEEESEESGKSRLVESEK